MAVPSSRKASYSSGRPLERSTGRKRPLSSTLDDAFGGGSKLSTSSFLAAATVSTTGGGGGGIGGAAARMFVGNLDMRVSEGDILKVFSRYGTIAQCNFLWHHEVGPRRGQPRGFCFVEMATPSEAHAAISALNGRLLKGRTLRVNIAREEVPLSDDAPGSDASSASGGRAGDTALLPPPKQLGTLERSAWQVKQQLQRMGVQVKEVPTTTTTTTTVTTSITSSSSSSSSGGEEKEKGGLAAAATAETETADADAETG